MSSRKSYKDEKVAGDMIAVVGRLRAVKDSIQNEAVYERTLGLTGELEDAVRNYASGTDLSNFASQLATLQAERAIVGKAVASAIMNLNVAIDALEI